MTTDKTPVEVEATPALLIYYDRFHMENETLSDFISRIMTEHNRERSRSKSRAKFDSALGVMFIISMCTIYILEFFKFADTTALWVSFIIGGVGGILYYYKPFKGRVGE